MSLKVYSKVVARFIESNIRKEVKDLVKPLNKLKGINPSTLKDQGKLMPSGHDEVVLPKSHDIQPKDVFTPKPKYMGVRNLAETGKDLSNAIEKVIPKDKGYSSVKNLSQYLIDTEDVK